MKLNELFTEPQPLLEGKQLEVYDALLPFLLFEEDEGSPGDGETPDDVTPSPPPVQPPGGGGWYRPGPFRPGGMGMSGNHWFNELYASLKHLAVASNILKRLKVLGVTGSGAKRVQLAAKTAAKHVRLLLSNPGATAYRLPVWTFDTPPRQRIKVWNEAFQKEFQKELSKIDLNESQVIDRLAADIRDNWMSKNEEELFAFLKKNFERGWMDYLQDLSDDELETVITHAYYQAHNN